jgi:hypothetical protein
MGPPRRVEREGRVDFPQSVRKTLRKSPLLLGQASLLQGLIRPALNRVRSSMYLYGNNLHASCGLAATTCLTHRSFFHRLCCDTDLGGVCEEFASASQATDWGPFPIAVMKCVW